MPGSLDRPGQPTAPDQPGQSDVPGELRSSPRTPPPDGARAADRSSSLDQPLPWSRADLQQRLERLPPGHPSALRADDLDRDRPLGLRDLDSTSFGEEAEPDGGLHPDEPAREPDAIKRDYWRGVPRFLQAWADHVSRWPAERVAAAVDRSRDPAGSWRGDGNQYLNPEQHAQAKDVIVGVQRAEKTVSGHLKETEQENACGGWLEGMKFRLKGEDRLKEKIADSLRIAPAKTPTEVMREIPDTIRYTFCFERGNYAEGYLDIRERLQERGYRMIYSKNHWRDDPEYKGINTRWITQEGHRFELQFHSAESYHAKQQVTHSSYERIRNRLTGRSERRELEAFQREVCTWISVPGEASNIPDYEERA